MPTTAPSTRQELYDSIARLKGKTLANRLLPLLNAEPNSPAPLHAASDVHESHQRATTLLEPHREALGPSYPTIHLLARWSLEHATDTDPAPHLLTTYWSLEEATGKSSRTLMRHLVEESHPWSATVKTLIDVRHNYGEMQVGDSTRPCIVGTVIRFFPKGRLTPRARVCRWGERDLIAEADAGRTRPCRPQPPRYQRRTPRMSAYTALKEQAVRFNWVMIHVGRSAPEENKILADLYADIPKQHVLNALRADLAIHLERAQVAGHSLARARYMWIEFAARTLAHRFNDAAPKPHFSVVAAHGGVCGYRLHGGKVRAVPKDGFTCLWRLALWAASRAEDHSGSSRGWFFLHRLGVLANEGDQMGIGNPIAWAWTIVNREGFNELIRDYGRSSPDV